MTDDDEIGIIKTYGEIWKQNDGRALFSNSYNTIIWSGDMFGDDGEQSLLVYLQARMIEQVDLIGSGR